MTKYQNKLYWIENVLLKFKVLRVYNDLYWILKINYLNIWYKC